MQRLVGCTPYIFYVSNLWFSACQLISQIDTDQPRLKISAKARRMGGLMLDWGLNSPVLVKKGNKWS